MGKKCVGVGLSAVSCVQLQAQEHEKYVGQQQKKTLEISRKKKAQESRISVLKGAVGGGIVCVQRPTWNTLCLRDVHKKPQPQHIASSD